ncbi:MAG TPA: indolepyruvate oxidoreductase subunit beta [Firmicutes bacterium]|jgi:indolepyruvate ferredoxin oxidoreductase beta subunit|nr:indolepyruvate oxidoreductase subunit beta [Bacillota bacterium]
MGAQIKDELTKKRWPGPEDVYNIILAGVGGQGILFAARVLGTAALMKGYDVKVSEVHGMAQRGGSVVSYVRFGRKVYAPVVEKGRCDLLVAFEELEGLRWLDHLCTGGRVILNRQRIDPMPVISGKAEYPKEIPAIIRRRAGSVELVDALTIAGECGSLRTVNTVLLGLTARFLPVEEEIWLETLAEVAPARMLDVNRQAFIRGYRYTQPSGQA